MIRESLDVEGTFPKTQEHYIEGVDETKLDTYLKKQEEPEESYNWGSSFMKDLHARRTERGL